MQRLITFHGDCCNRAATATNPEGVTLHHSETYAFN